MFLCKAVVKIFRPKLNSNSSTNFLVKLPNVKDYGGKKRSRIDERCQTDEKIDRATFIGTPQNFEHA